MFEKVNPSHPDKIADRIAGAMLDLAYSHSETYPRVAIEVLLGHGECNIIAESSYGFSLADVKAIVNRIAGKQKVRLKVVPQDTHLAENQSEGIRCGDNGIFKGMPTTYEEEELTRIAKVLYNTYKTDGKYILDGNKLIICQSYAKEDDAIIEYLKGMYEVVFNPLGYWTGGTDVDTGCTNRKLGSDMGESVTGGGIMAKDMSKADVSVNIYAWLKAQEKGEPVEMCCAIGDDKVSGVPYSEIVKVAKDYIDSIGGFEKFAEWGLIR